MTSDGHSLDDGMRVAFEDRSVHECTGVALVCVTGNILHVALCALGEHPLSACGEARAAASAETRIEQFLNYLIGSHLEQYLSECLITLGSDVFVYVLGVDNAAVAKRYSLLLLIESSLGERIDRTVGVYGLLIKKILNDVAVLDMLVNNSADALGGSLRIERTLGVNDHDGTQCAKTEAARSYNEDFLLKTFLFQLVLESFEHLLTARGGTARTAADEYLLSVAGLFGELSAFLGNYLSDSDEVSVFVADLIKFCNSHYSSPPLSA